MCWGYTHTHTDSHTHLDPCTRTHTRAQIQRQPGFTGLQPSEQFRSTPDPGQPAGKAAGNTTCHLEFRRNTASVLNSHRTRFPAIRVYVPNTLRENQLQSRGPLLPLELWWWLLRLFASLTARHWTKAAQHELIHSLDTRVHLERSDWEKNPELEPGLWMDMQGTDYTQIYFMQQWLSVYVSSKNNNIDLHIKHKNSSYSTI